MKFYLEQLELLERKLSLLEKENVSIYQNTEVSIKACQQWLELMRERVLQYGFKNEKEECHFFKTVKPKIVGYMFHYLNLVHLERHRPLLRTKLQIKFFETQIALLQNYYLEHQEFYEYYLRDKTHLDLEFFTRKSNAPQFHLDSIAFLLDANFSTSHDMVLAKILGNSHTIAFIQRKLSSKANVRNVERDKKSALHWTGSKVDLVELVYALQASGVVNNGAAEIKELAINIEQLFGIELGDIYRTFIEIRNRKNKPTKLLDFLKISLTNKIMEDGI